MMMVIETVQSARDAILVFGYKCVMRPGGRNPFFRYDDSDRIAFKQVPHRNVSPEPVGNCTACSCKDDRLTVTSSRLQRTMVLVSCFYPSDYPSTFLHCKSVMVPSSTRLHHTRRYLEL